MKVYSTYSSTRGVWRTGWVTTKSKKTEEQIFRIKQMFSPPTSFTYKQIKEDIKGCVNEAREKDLGCSSNDYITLEEFMEQFILDVEEKGVLE